MSKKILLAAINAKYIHSNLAVYCLDAYARKYSEAVKDGRVSVIYREFTINQQIDEILEEIYREKPDVIGFSCYIWNISYVMTLIKELKVLLPHTDIWLGGPEVSYNREEILQEHPEITGVMCGEGERVFASLCDYYGNDTEGEFDSTPPQPIDLSSLPFIYADEAETEQGTELVPNALFQSLKHKILYYETSRGCPFSCSYCLSSLDKAVRFRSIDKVLKEIQFFLDHQVSQVKFVDRTFNCNRSHATAIWKYIAQHDNGITNFHFEIGADLLGEEELEILKNMWPGLVQLEIGVQSTNDITIKEVSRKMDLVRLKEVVQKLRGFQNINLHLDLIAGLPYEDFESFKHSFNEIYALYSDQLQLGFLKVLKGSAIAEKSEKYGIAYRSYPPYEVLYTDWLSFDEILKLKQVEDMVEQYYNSEQFTCSLRYLLTYFDTPFAMFEKLGEYYEVHFEKNKKHARIDRYRILLQFFRDFFAERPELHAEEQILRELMTFDVYLRENMKTRPDFAPDVQEYRDSFRQISREMGHHGEHIEALSGRTWKLIRDMGIPVQTWNTQVELPESVQIVGFDYNERNPLNYNAAVYQI